MIELESIFRTLNKRNPLSYAVWILIWQFRCWILDHIASLLSIPKHLKSNAFTISSTPYLKNIKHPSSPTHESCHWNQDIVFPIDCQVISCCDVSVLWLSYPPIRELFFPKFCLQLLCHINKAFITFKMCNCCEEDFWSKAHWMNEHHRWHLPPPRIRASHVLYWQRPQDQWVGRN